MSHDIAIIEAAKMRCYVAMAVLRRRAMRAARRPPAAEVRARRAPREERYAARYKDIYLPASAADADRFKRESDS